MRPNDILFWLRAEPFVPFRIRMNSGQFYDVRHPENVRLMRSSLVLFTPSEQEGVFDHGQMIGLVLIERIEPADAPAAAS
jgi:hypothetical protein